MQKLGQARRFANAIGVWSIRGAASASLIALLLAGCSGEDASGGDPGGSGARSGSSGRGGKGGGGGKGGTGGTNGGSGSGGASGTGGGASGSTSSGGTSGSAGTGGTSGSAGTGGTSGSAGTGGTSGSAGSGGSSGTAGTGGTAGTAGSAGTGGVSGSAGTAGTSGSGGTGGGSTFPPVTDFAAPGPFMTTRVAEGPSCTIFRPNPLGAEGRKHPIIIWGNGTGASVTTYQAALTHWASHGFIVAAANTSGAGTGTEMIACLTYVIQQNGVTGSVYLGKVDPGHVGASGHSQGGGGTLMAGRDARVTVTAPLQPYTAQGFGGYDQASIAQQKGAMFLMSGSGDTIATPTPNQSRVYSGATVPVFWGTLAGATHTGTAIGNIGGYRGPSTAWFRAHLMNDQTARALFYGASCGLCSNSSWTVQRKNIQ